MRARKKSIREKKHPQRPKKGIRGDKQKAFAAREKIIRAKKKRDKSSTARQYKAQSIRCRAMLMIRYIRMLVIRAIFMISCIFSPATPPPPVSSRHV